VGSGCWLLAKSGSSRFANLGLLVDVVSQLLEPCSACWLGWSTSRSLCTSASFAVPEAFGCPFLVELRIRGGHGFDRAGAGVGVRRLAVDIL
jgi:hypothetical protein